MLSSPGILPVPVARERVKPFVATQAVDSSPQYVSERKSLSLKSVCIALNEMSSHEQHVCSPGTQYRPTLHVHLKHLFIFGDVTKAKWAGLDWQQMTSVNDGENATGCPLGVRDISRPEAFRTLTCLFLSG
ncbi:hypothetical protein E1301_Tti018125 [Triplophysa tibetana]|uniref:Uncharacterized protein n=1 Tax=Triplophysa tibetana TaxID=1572043 RepID=A0A5A9PHC0_9TELE|nr:hypothetical protein E1301_Tti018125 [Triplophysa tibetana]